MNPDQIHPKHLRMTFHCTKACWTTLPLKINMLFSCLNTQVMLLSSWRGACKIYSSTKERNIVENTCTALLYRSVTCTNGGVHTHTGYTPIHRLKRGKPPALSFLAAICSLVIILLPGIDFWIAGPALLLWTERSCQYKSYHYIDEVK